MVTEESSFEAKSWRKILAPLLVALFAGSPVALSAETPCRTYEARARQCADQHRISEALALIDKAIEANPRDAHLFVYKAELLNFDVERSGNSIANGLNCIRIAEGLGEKSADLYMQKAQLLSAAGKRKEAMVAVNLALQQKQPPSERIFSLALKAELLAEAKDFDQASKLLDAAANGEKLRNGDLIRHAEWCIAAKRFEQAGADAKQVLKRHKGQDGGYFQKLGMTLLAKAYEGEGKTELARKEYLELAKIWNSDRQVVDSAYLFFKRIGDLPAAKAAKLRLDAIDADVRPF